VKRGWFWPLIGVGSALYALAAASFAYAFANRNYADANRIGGQLSEGWTNYVPLADADACFTCVEPLPWLIAGVVLALAGFIPYLAASRYH
jgi:hypothetical protein